MKSEIPQGSITEEGITEEGITEEGILEEGVTEEGITEEGIMEEGITEEGITEEGITEEGIMEDGVMEDSITGDSMEGFLYETHMHTSEGSACAVNTGAEMARAYSKAGYTGIIVTDHFFYGNTAVDRSLPWRQWVERFCLGYEHAKEEGEKAGLQVFFGWESCYGGPEFLIYGLDKDWLLEHPEVRDATVEEQMRLVHEGGSIISQAHPFREAHYISRIQTFPDHVDAVEGINASHSSRNKADRHPEFNARALRYAKEHDLPLTAGSDQHSLKMLGGGMVFPRKLADIHDFGRAVLNRQAVRLLDGTEKD